MNNESFLALTHAVVTSRKGVETKKSELNKVESANPFPNINSESKYNYDKVAEYIKWHALLNIAKEALVKQENAVEVNIANLKKAIPVEFHEKKITASGYGYPNYYVVINENGEVEIGTYDNWLNL